MFQPSGWIVEAPWLRQQFAQDQWTDLDAQQHARAYIFQIIGTTMFPDYSTNLVPLRWLPLLEDFDACGVMSWGSTVLAFLYRELYKVATMQTTQIQGHSTLL